MNKVSNIRLLWKLKGLTMMAVFSAFCGAETLAQDIHFSQNFSSPFQLNPALTGDFHGDYRVVGNYRNQWNSITIPYRTFAIAGDARKILGYDPVSAGLAFYNDVAGDAALSTTSLQASASFEYAVSSDERQSIVFGVQPGMIRQDLDVNKLTFDNQYNEQTGLYDATMQNGESYRSTKNMWFTFNAGMRYSYKIAPRNQVDGGVSVYNLAGPASDKRYISTTSNRDQLAKRYNFHASYQRKVHEKVDLIPGIVYSNQGRNKQMILGMSSRYLYNGSTALHIGYWYRAGDAGFATFGVTYRTLYMAVSYDINTSKLREASNGRGAIEFSLIYVFHKFKPNNGRYMSCPNYL